KNMLGSQKVGLPWRSWLSRSAVNRKVVGSNPTGSVFLLINNQIPFKPFIYNEIFPKYVISHSYTIYPVYIPYIIL
ncbi:hypothetical protein NEAUS04_2702, partial [Nematocida ausubeli]